MRTIRVNELITLRRDISIGTEQEHKAVLSILNEVKEKGDEALYSLTQKFDGVLLSSLKVTDDEISEAYELIDIEIIKYLNEAGKNIREYH